MFCEVLENERKVTEPFAPAPAVRINFLGKVRGLLTDFDGFLQVQS